MRESRLSKVDPLLLSFCVCGRLLLGGPEPGHGGGRGEGVLQPDERRDVRVPRRARQQDAQHPLEEEQQRRRMVLGTQRRIQGEYDTDGSICEAPANNAYITPIAFSLRSYGILVVLSWLEIPCAVLFKLLKMSNTLFDL